MNPLADSEIRDALAPERRIIASDHDADVVVRRLHGAGRPSSSRSRRWRTPLALGAVMVTALAAQPVAAAVGDLVSEFGQYFSNPESAAVGPGEPVQSTDEAPAWLTADGRSGQRLLASEGEHRLYAVRQPSGAFAFALDDSIGISDSVRGWEQQLNGNSVVVLGPASSPDPNGTIALFGISATSVAAVEVSYEVGQATTAPVGDGGFIAAIDPERSPMSLTAIDASGSALQVIDLRPLHLAP